MGFPRKPVLGGTSQASVQGRWGKAGLGGRRHLESKLSLPGCFFSYCLSEGMVAAA